MRRIIYLGGLAHGKSLSPHMRSRAETGNILRSSGIPVIEFQASIVIGSGSASFELIRALVERLPVMITPRWVKTAAQPIAVEDVVEYLAAAIKLEIRENVTVEIGGSDVTSYLGVMREYARLRKLRRWFLATPFLTPALSSRWLTLITPVYSSIGRCLIESVRNPSVVCDPRMSRLFGIEPMGVSRAIARALANEDRASAETRWCEAEGFGASGAEFQPSDIFRSAQHAGVPLLADEAFAPIRRIGGQTGWYFGTWIWKIRGFRGRLRSWLAKIAGNMQVKG